MKTRTDFVSNSSSSSFILRDAGFFKLFGVTAEDVDRAITDMYGGKAVVEKQLADAVSDCEVNIVRAAANGPDAAEDEDYYRKRLAGLRRNGLGLWCVYDMTDKVSAGKCRRKWGDHLSDWFAPAEGYVEEWKKFVDILQYRCHIGDVRKAATMPSIDCLSHWSYCDGQKRPRRKKLIGAGRLVRCVKKELGVRTMKEVLYDPDCTMMIHFAENVVYSLAGMTAESKRYASAPYSSERFFEILIRQLAKAGKVDLSDPKLLEFWKVDDADEYFKKTNPGKKYYLDSVTSEDVYDELLCVNAILHEG